MAVEDAGGVTSRKFPQTQSLVPGRRQSVGTVRGDNLYITKKAHQSAPFLLYIIHILFLSMDGFDLGGRRKRQTYTVGDGVGVALQASLGVPVGLVVASQVPDDQSLIATGGEQHVGAVMTLQLEKPVQLP